MTLAEVRRAIESRERQKKIEAQERASFDYILADLIGKSVSRVYSSQNKYPEIYNVYPTLFDTKEIQEKERAAKAEASALRFKQFAQAYNNNLNKEANK